MSPRLHNMSLTGRIRHVTQVSYLNIFLIAALSS